MSLKGCTTRRRPQWEQGYLWKIEGLDGGAGTELAQNRLVQGSAGPEQG
jgi:hypothetical protein